MTTMDKVASADGSAKRYAGAVARNKDPLLSVLKPRLDDIVGSNDGDLHCVEIAGGTGEHASYFCSHMPYLSMLPIEPDIDSHASIRAFRDESDDTSLQSRIADPVSLDIRQVLSNKNQLPSVFLEKCQCILCINMIHICDPDAILALFDVASELLSIDNKGILCTYGPYMVNGDMTESNWAFDRSLKARNANWGIRELSLLQEIAKVRGMKLIEMVEMPSNNLFLVWGKTA
jgi:hypothetical protein